MVSLSEFKNISEQLSKISVSIKESEQKAYYDGLVLETKRLKDSILSFSQFVASNSSVPQEFSKIRLSLLELLSDIDIANKLL